MTTPILCDMDPVEVALEQLLHAGDYTRAASLAIENYGAELFGFLINVLGNSTSAEDVFSQVGEDLWRGLPAFSHRASMRTWLYTIAKHAAQRYKRSPWNRADRRTGSSELDAAMAKVRSATESFRRSDVKASFRALRDELPLEDRVLLVLRVDRNLAWNEVARVLAENEGELDDIDLARESGRLRKRFQLLKTELRRRAKALGLIDDDEKR